MAKAKHPRYKSHNRPRKSGAAKNRRTKNHRKRVIALGVPADKVAKMNTEQLRELLKAPLKTKKKFAKAK
jgi:hypothetical protein